MTEHFLAPGHAYTFNTNIPHRVYVKEPCNTPRIHLVLGFAPGSSMTLSATAGGPTSTSA